MADIRRGSTWALLPAYTLDGYLCFGMKEGYYNTEEFIFWLENELLPAIRRKYETRGVVIVMDNVSIHCDPRVVEVLEGAFLLNLHNRLMLIFNIGAGHVVEYLPPYSPDFNPIELTFSVLKSWIKRNQAYMRWRFNDYGSLLDAAVRESRCDRFGRQHFKFAAGGGLYIEEAELERIQEEHRAADRICVE